VKLISKYKRLRTERMVILRINQDRATKHLSSWMEKISKDRLALLSIKTKR